MGMKPTVESNAELVNTQLHTRNYRDFRPFTSKTDYPHQPIIAYGEKKKIQQITRTGG